jgi:PDZ domain-containing protein
LKDWDIIKQEEILLSNETDKDLEKRGEITLNQSFNNAVVYAFEKAGKKIDILSRKLYITYVAEGAKTDLKVGDQIIAINDSNVETKNDIAKILESYDAGEEVSIKVISSKKEIMRKAKIIEVEGVKKIGVVIETLYDYKTSIEVKRTEKNGEMGSSGGFANALYIYSLLVDKDIIKNRKIVATGTIDENGDVGEIGGVKYKLKAAVRSKSNIFFVPDLNCEEALKLKKDNNYNLNVVCIKNFDDAITYLEK